jgi:protein SCO1/2
MDRRRYLAAVGSVAAVGGTAGCLGSLAGGNPNVVLSEPDRQFDSEDVPYPAWGEQVPDVSLPAPLESGELALRDVSKPALVTFFYSRCQTVCPVLIGTLRNVQAHAANNGYADDVTIVPITFDPQRDDAQRLQRYAKEMNVDASADNWTFLRPPSKERAKDVISEQFGVVFQRTHPEDMDMYMFAHTSLTLLVNADGYVERAYNTKSPKEDTVLSDLQEVRQA